MDVNMNSTYLEREVGRTPRLFGPRQFSGKFSNINYDYFTKIKNVLLRITYDYYSEISGYIRIVSRTLMKNIIMK